MANGVVKKTVYVATAGTLSNYISESEKYQIEELTVTGELNGTDIRFIRHMSGIDYEYHENNNMKPYSNISTPGVLKKLDISNAKIVGGGIYYCYSWIYDDYYTTMCATENTIGDYMFSSCKLTSIKLPNSVISIGYEAFADCSGLTSITIPNSVISIGEEAFIICI